MAEQSGPVAAGHRRLCIFARVPAAGVVKRRLVPALGEAGALAAYSELLQGTLERCVAPADYVSELWLSGDVGDPQVSAWLDRFRLTVHEQRGSDLGERMRQALELDVSGGTTAVLIGTDCPEIDRAYVLAAFTALLEHDVVLGPARDGGYGLIGLRRPLPELFRNMAWGSATVCAETLDRARRRGAAVHCLAQIYDVDRPEDWFRYRSLNPPPGRGSE